MKKNDRPKQFLLTVSLGTKLRDRDSRGPTRIGEVESIGSAGIRVHWNTGKTTTISPKGLRRYEIVR